MVRCFRASLENETSAPFHWNPRQIKKTLPIPMPLIIKEYLTTYTVCGDKLSYSVQKRKWGVHSILWKWTGKAKYIDREPVSEGRITGEIKNQLEESGFPSQTGFINGLPTAYRRDVI